MLSEWLENFKLKVSTGKRAKTTLIQWEDYVKKLKNYFGQREITSILYSEYDKIITHFETVLNLHTNTSAHLFKFLKRILEYAVSCDYATKNPFRTIHVETVEQKKIYLQTEELHSLEGHTSPLKEHNISKDVFLFCAYTGFSYSDYKNLTNKNLITYKNRQFIVIDFRRKSPIMKRYGKSIVPVHKKLSLLIAKYNGLDNLPMKKNENSTTNKHLKFFWGKISVTPQMALKNARHTFSNYARKYWRLHKDTIQIITGHANRETKTLDMHYLDENLETLYAHLENIKNFWD